MIYITAAELSERPGSRELAEVATAAHEQRVDYDLMEATLLGTDRSAWTVDEVALADDALARIEEAVAEAESTVDGFLARRRYTLPLSPVPKIVTGWVRSISRYLLHKDRMSRESDDPIVRDYKDAMKLLQLTADGKFSLGAEDEILNDPNRVDVGFELESDGKVFGRDSMRNY